MVNRCYFKKGQNLRGVKTGFELIMGLAAIFIFHSCGHVPIVPEWVGRSGASIKGQLVYGIGFATQLEPGIARDKAKERARESVIQKVEGADHLGQCQTKDTWEEKRYVNDYVTVITAYHYMVCEYVSDNHM